MRKHVSILLPVLLVIGLVLGCGEDVAKPQITRLSASETCGVAPLRVDFRGDATGGAPLADPTGTNNWLKFTWDFGDGTVIENGTSIAYHEYAAPGTYLATLTAEDDGGDRASRSLMVDVRADSLVVEAYSEVAGVLTSDVKTCEPVTFAITADACDFDPVRDSYERYVYRWTAGGVTYRDPSPVLTFSDADVGPQAVTLVLEDPVRSITRYDTLTVNVTASAGADLSLATNWLLSPEGTAASLLERNIPQFPDTLTVSYVLTNDGPENAYFLEVTGALDDNNRIAHIEGVVGAGVYVYDDVDDHTWSWRVDEIPAGESVTLDITFRLDQALAGNTYEFTADLTPYACDPDDDDISATADLDIVSIP